MFLHQLRTRAWLQLPRIFSTAVLLAAFDVSAASDARPGLDVICGECKLEKFASCGPGKFIEGPSVDRSGKLWLTALNAGELLTLSPSGECSVAATIGGAPNGARFGRDGKLVITDRDRNLLSFDPATGSVKTLRNKHGRETLRGLNDSAIDRSGGIYFTESYGSNAIKPDGRVFYLPADDVHAGKRDLVVVAGGFAFPNGLVLSPDESVLYVNDYARNRILALPLSAPGTVGAFTIPYVFANLSGGVGPDGAAVDADGNVYVAHYRAGEVVVFDPQGFSYGALRLPRDAGIGTTNVVMHDGFLYITESLKNEVWRVRLRVGPPSR